MKRLLLAAAALLAAPCAHAQSIDDLNLQFHGFATQSFLYSNHNSWNTTDSENGSAAWTEAVVNISGQPQPRFRIGIQARYNLLGDFGNKITLDWAQGDLQINDHLGFRVGKVKTPSSLFNETQDIDPAYLWCLLPQSIYPIASRDTTLAHNGGVVYGQVALGESLGKLEYRGFAGQRSLASDDGYLQTFRDEGITLPNGLRSTMYGATLRWTTPLRGLLIGATYDSEHAFGEITSGSISGKLDTNRFTMPYYFAKFERGKLLFAAEYNRFATTPTLQYDGLPAFAQPTDQRSFYGMATYHATSKLSAGAYFSGQTDHRAAFTAARYQKDWAFASRYDFTPFLYAKFEQHLIDGTATGFAAFDNPDLKPRTRMTLLKLGVSF